MLEDRETNVARSGKPKAPSTARTRARGKAVALIVIAVLALGASAWAEGETSTTLLPEDAASASTNTADEDDVYDIDASGADIRFVLEALARRSGANIVVSPDVSGEITAHLKQMSIDSILSHLSTVHGFSWKRDGDTYLVASKDKFETPVPPEPGPAPEPESETLVWNCRHVKPDDVASVIKELFPSIKIAAGPGAVTPVLDVTPSGVTNLGGGATSGTSTASKNTGTMVVLLGDPDDIAKAREVLTQIDVRRPQVSVHVAVVEVSRSANKELGIDWSWTDLVLTEQAASSGIHFGNLNKSSMTFTGVLSALIESGDGNLLAQPNISVVDGECADILIGDRILFPKLIGYTDLGTAIYDVEEERVGIYLQIAPRVAGDDEILMTLYPQVSLVTSYLKTQAGDYPLISTREARTTVSVKNGETLAIGGLLRDDEIREASKIPLLGDLPIIGQLFRHVKKTKQRTEIVIFLTPNIVDQEAT